MDVGVGKLAYLGSAATLKLGGDRYWERLAVIIHPLPVMKIRERLPNSASSSSGCSEKCN
jgi:hypothetical protein